MTSPVRHLRGVTPGLVFTFLMLLPATVMAAQANVSHAYSTNENIKKGSLVSLDPSNSGGVVLADSDNGPRLFGVAVNSNDSLLAIDSGPNTVQVATNGLVNVLVSNINGDIKSGDQVSVSALEGVGMEATPGSHIIGLASSSFPGDAKGIISESVKANNGGSTDVKIGYLPINIAVGTASSAQTKYTGLEKLAVELTGHTIPVVRIVIALIIAIIAIVQLFASTYVAIYGSIMSIGRNPLAKGAVLRALRFVVIATIFTAVIATLAILLLLN